MSHSSFPRTQFSNLGAAEVSRSGKFVFHDRACFLEALIILRYHMTSESVLSCLFRFRKDNLPASSSQVRTLQHPSH